MRLPSACLLWLLLWWGSGPASAQITGGNATVSTTEIVTAALDLTCQAYQPIGICIWMTCTRWGVSSTSRCGRSTTSRSRGDRLPFLGNTSWPESNGFARPTEFAEDGGASDEGGATVREQALKFKNSDVIGSPGVADYWLLAAASTEALPFCTAHLSDDALFCEQLRPGLARSHGRSRPVAASCFRAGRAGRRHLCQPVPAARLRHPGPRL